MHRDRVDAQLGQDLRRGQRVGDVRLARGALLALVRLRGEAVGLARGARGRPAGSARGPSPRGVAPDRPGSAPPSRPWGHVVGPHPWTPSARRRAQGPCPTAGRPQRAARSSFRSVRGQRPWASSVPRPFVCPRTGSGARRPVRAVRARGTTAGSMTRSKVPGWRKGSPPNLRLKALKPAHAGLVPLLLTLGDAPHVERRGTVRGEIGHQRGHRRVAAVGVTSAPGRAPRPPTGSGPDRPTAGRPRRRSPGRLATPAPGTSHRPAGGGAYARAFTASSERARKSARSPVSCHRPWKAARAAGSPRRSTVVVTPSRPRGGPGAGRRRATSPAAPRRRRGARSSASSGPGGHGGQPAVRPPGASR